MYKRQGHILIIQLGKFVVHIVLEGVYAFGGIGAADEVHLLENLEGIDHSQDVYKRQVLSGRLPRSGPGHCQRPEARERLYRRRHGFQLSLIHIFFRNFNTLIVSRS